MYAIVKTGGKQYRVEEGLSLLVERLPVDDGARISLQPLLYVDGSTMIDGARLAEVQVQARVLAHERGPKLRIVKFKPKRGYKRRTGHRQELTRIEVTAIDLAARRTPAKRTQAAPPPVATGADRPGPAPETVSAARPEAASAVENPMAAVENPTTAVENPTAAVENPTAASPATQEATNGP